MRSLMLLRYRRSTALCAFFLSCAVLSGPWRLTTAFLNFSMGGGGASDIPTLSAAGVVDGARTCCEECDICCGMTCGIDWGMGWDIGWGIGWDRGCGMGLLRLSAGCAALWANEERRSAIFIDDETLLGVARFGVAMCLGVETWLGVAIPAVCPLGWLPDVSVLKSNSARNMFGS